MKGFNRCAVGSTLFRALSDGRPVMLQLVATAERGRNNWLMPTFIRRRLHPLTRDDIGSARLARLRIPIRP